MLLSPNNRSFFLRVTSTESVGSENPLGVMFAVGNNCDQLVAFRKVAFIHTQILVPLEGWPAMLTHSMVYSAMENHVRSHKYYS